MNVKSPLESKTVNGFLLMALSLLSPILLGVKIPAEQLTGLGELLQNLPVIWAMLAGGAAAAFTRFWQQEFTWKAKLFTIRGLIGFVSALFVAVLGVLQSLSIDVTALRDFGDVVKLAWEALAPGVSSLLVLWGVVSAKRQIKTKEL